MLKNSNPRQSATQLDSSVNPTKQMLSILQKNNGWIGFDQFMQYALYDPDMGYYSLGAGFGEGGDFVTAPLLGNQFAHCIARQCIEVLDALRDDAPVVIEYGAGNGQLALDVLQYLSQHNQLPQHYFIVEISHTLRQRQRETIARGARDLIDLVSWVAAPPDDCAAIVFANELIDAFPVKRFEIAEGVAYELGVAYQKENFVWQRASQPLAEPLQSKLSSLALADGYQSEVNTLLYPWLSSLSAKLKSGVILLIDYGFPQREYYHLDRDQGTLMCHYRQQAHDNPFIHLGQQDITAHVDFSALADAATAVKLGLSGYCSQAFFLLSLGLLDTVADGASQQGVLHNQEIKKLTLPHEMGELFKVIALSKHYDKPLAGFNMKDDSGRL